jgi:hypothetical protein
MLYEKLEIVVLACWLVVLVLTLAWVFVGMSTYQKEQPLRRWASDRRAWIILLVLGLGFLFGTIGAYVKPPVGPEPQGQRWFGGLCDALYQGALQLLLNGDVERGDSVFTRMARLAGLASIILLAYEAIQQLFTKPLQLLWLSKQKRHVVVCGLGRVGRSIIKDLTESNQKPVAINEIAGAIGTRIARTNSNLVVIEIDKDNPNIPWAESRGVSVLIGDATDEDVLIQARIHKAKDVFVTVGADELNLECAYDSMRIVSSSINLAKLHVPRMFVHLLNPRLESMLVQARTRAFKQLDGKTNQIESSLFVQPFNVIDRSIQALVDGPVLDRRPINGEDIAHFVIVGFGEVGQDLSLKLAQLAHFENLKRCRMTIVCTQRDKDAAEKFQELFPKLFPNLSSYSAELEEAGLKAEDYSVWKPFKELDDWSFGVKIVKKPDSNAPIASEEVEIVDVPASRGIEFAVNGGFDFTSGGVTCDHFIRNLQELSLSKGVRPLVFICHAEDELNCADATELRDELDIRLKCPQSPRKLDYTDTREHRITILPYVPNRPMLHRLIDPPNRPGADMIPWGDCRETCTYDALTADLLRPLATAINHDYELKYAQRSASDNEANLPSREQIPVSSLGSLLSWERHSNLMAAAHVNLKLVPLGLVVQPWTGDEPIHKADFARINTIIERSIHHQVRKDWKIETEDDRLLEMVAKMEHHRWVAERLLMDWGFGERAPKGSPENKRRLAFVDWRNLSDSEGVKDRDQIARILELCRVELNRPQSERRFVIMSRS